MGIVVGFEYGSLFRQFLFFGDDGAELNNLNGNQILIYFQGKYFVFVFVNFNFKFIHGNMLKYFVIEWKHVCKND